MRRNRHILGAGIFVALMAGGCSPYAYKKEIESFAKSTNAFSAGVNEISADLIAQPGRRAYWEAYSNPDAQVILSPQKCLATNTKPTERCVMRVAGKDVGLSQVDLGVLQSLKSLHAFSKYASALSAVANAEDSANFNAAAGQLTTKTSAFVATISSGGGALVPPILQAGFALQRLTLEHARLKQLRKSVAEVDKVMPAATRRLSSALFNLKKARTEDLLSQMLLVEVALENEKNAADRALLIRTLQEGAADVARLQSQDPTKMVTAMAKSHGALAKALQSPEPKLEDVAREIAAFADIAEAFKAALSQD